MARAVLATSWLASALMISESLRTRVATVRGGGSCD